MSDFGWLCIVLATVGAGICAVAATAPYAEAEGTGQTYAQFKTCVEEVWDRTGGSITWSSDRWSDQLHLAYAVEECTE